MALVGGVRHGGEGTRVDKAANAFGADHAVHEHAGGDQAAIKDLLGRRSLEISHFSSGVEDALAARERLVVGARLRHVATKERN